MIEFAVCCTCTNDYARQCWQVNKLSRHAMQLLAGLCLPRLSSAARSACVGHAQSTNILHGLEEA